MNPSLIALIPASAMTVGVSKSGSPAANRITGTPAWTRAVAWSVMATVLDGLREMTLGLNEVSIWVSLTVPLRVPLEAADILIVYWFGNFFKHRKGRFWGWSLLKISGSWRVDLRDGLMEFWREEAMGGEGKGFGETRDD